MMSDLASIIEIVGEVEGHKTDTVSALWRLGDALVAECGPPGEVHVNNGAKSNLKQIAKALREAGFRSYSVAHLEVVRRTAARFAERERSCSLDFWIHALAGDPATLKEVQEKARVLVKPVTASFVRNFKTARRKRQEADEKKKNSRPGAIDPKRVTASQRFLEDAAQALAVGRDAAKVIQPYLLTDEELQAAQAVIAVWSRIVRQHQQETADMFDEAA